MYVNLNLKKDIISLQEDFISLEEIDKNGNFLVKVKYFLDQDSVFENKSFITNIVISQNNIIPNKLNNYDLPNNTNIATALLKNFSLTKDSLKNNAKTFITAFNSDISSFINNEILSLKNEALKNTDLPISTKRTIKYRNKEELKSENKELISNLSASFNSEIPDIQNDFYSLIAAGKEPSSITDNRFNNNLFEQNLGSFKKLQSKDRVIERILDNLLSKKNPTIGIEIARERNKILEISELITIPADKIEINNNAIITFKLLNNQNLVVDLKEKEINLLKMININNSVINKINVNITRQNILGKDRIEISKIEKKIKSIKLYKKIISPYEKIIPKYNFAEEINVSGKERASIVVDNSLNNTILYRLIPVNIDGITDYNFYNIISKPTKTSYTKNCSIISSNSLDGILIEMRNFPINAYAVSLYRKDKTIYDKNFSIVETPIFIGDKLFVYSILDKNVKENHCYEYKCKIIEKQGQEYFCSNNSIIEHIPKTDIFQIEMNDFTVDHDNFNVTFSFKSKILDSNYNKLRKILSQQGLLDIFENELKNDKENLNRLVSHSINRYNLTSGENEDFGVIFGDHFDDKEQSKINACQPLNENNLYRYQIETLIRDPETMFENFFKTKKDSVTNKKYSFKPSKFFHPIIFKHGNISTITSQKVNYAKEQFEFGRTGNIKTIDVSFISEAPKIIDAKAAKLNKNLILINWNLIGNKDLIDHFIISKIFSGHEEIVGKSHALSAEVEFKFIHRLEAKDVGKFVYKILPILNTYKVGNSAITNEVFI